jgi:hypothetical protein
MQMGQGSSADMGAKNLHVGQSASDDRSAENMKVGMVLLPDNLDVDPGLMSLAMRKPYSNMSADTIKL